MNLLAVALLQSLSIGVPAAPPAVPAISVVVRPPVVEAVAVPPAPDAQAQRVTVSAAATAAEYPSAWPGKFETRATGEYLGARYYGSKMGRFTTVDPAMEIERSILDPQNWNRYAYARNNPLRNVDPHGRSWVKAGKLILKGGDVASTFAGTIEAAATIASGNPAIGTGARLVAVGSLLGEVSGVTDLVKAGKAGLDDAGDVMRTGRTNDLARRRGEHARDPRTQDLEFEVDRCTDCYAAQRGREQVIHDRYKPPLNRVNPVSPNNPRRDEYLQAAEKIKDPQ